MTWIVGMVAFSFLVCLAYRGLGNREAKRQAERLFKLEAPALRGLHGNRQK